MIISKLDKVLPGINIAAYCGVDAVGFIGITVYMRVETLISCVGMTCIF